MRSSDRLGPSLGTLLSSWLALTGWIFTAFVSRAKQQTEKVGQAVKDTILDLGDQPSAAERARPEHPQPLALLDANDLVSALRGRVEETLYDVAHLLNEDVYGCWEGVTVDRVHALFEELAREALERALEMRVAAEEARLGPQLASSSRWARKLRRMLAAEGRWPPEP
jgi:hypothetical protein